MTRPNERHRLELLAMERPIGSDLRTVELDVQTAHGPVLGGVDESGCLHLLVPVDQDIDVASDLQSRGIGITPRVFSYEGNEIQVVDFFCRSPDQNRVFVPIALEALSELEMVSADASSIPRETLERWRRAFQMAAQADIPRKKLIGIYGELAFLEELANRDQLLSLDLWTGPANQRHDFSGRDASLEVKTTEVSSSRSVQIHGLEQLEPKFGQVLYLGYVRLESNPNGRSASSLVDSLLDLGVDEPALRTKLEQAGYVHSFAAKERFVVREQSIYRVGSTFPRLIPTDLKAEHPPTGVSGVSYSIDIAALDNPLDNDACEAAYAEILRGRS